MAAISKKLQQCIKDVGDLPLQPDQDKLLENLGIPKEKRTYNMMLAISVYENAIEGNSKFLDLILNVLGVKAQDIIANKKLKLEKKKLEHEIEIKSYGKKDEEEDEL